jgi:hypothetical protein
MSSSKWPVGLWSETNPTPPSGGYRNHIAFDMGYNVVPTLEETQR